jgi:hypothetical protein
MLSRVGALGKVGGTDLAAPVLGAEPENWGRRYLRQSVRFQSRQKSYRFGGTPRVSGPQSEAELERPEITGVDERKNPATSSISIRRSIKGGSGESVAALRATGRRDLRRLRGRMMYATIPAKSTKRTTTTTETASVVIFELRLPRVRSRGRLGCPFSFLWRTFCGVE